MVNGLLGVNPGESQNQIHPEEENKFKSELKREIQSLKNKWELLKTNTQRHVR